MKAVQKLVWIVLCSGVLCGGVLFSGSAAWAQAAPADGGADSSAAAEQSAADDSKPDYTAQTISNEKIPVDQLAILVKPLTIEELQVEAGAWFDLLRAKASRIAELQIAVKKLNESTQAAAEVSEEAAEGETPPPPATDNAASKDELLAQISTVQDQRTAAVDRLTVVLDSLDAKGDDTKQYRDFMTAVSGLEIDTSDASATMAAVTGWLKSDEGGRRWAWNFAQFFAMLLVSWMAAKLIEKMVNWLLEKRLNLTQLSERLISKTIKNVILVIGIVIALTALEIDITPLIAAIGATGFILGFALQGTLSNFASGLLILVNRPFDVGDVVTAGGVTGSIHEMNLVSTTFRTFDNQTIHVPNNNIWGNVITNITANETRRVDLEFGIGYDDDFEQAEQIMREVVEAHELVLDDPEPTIVTHMLADSSVNIVCRPWAKTGDWWTVKTDVTREIKKRFDAAGISIPYPQRDVHIYQHHSGGDSAQ